MEKFLYYIHVKPIKKYEDREDYFLMADSVNFVRKSDGSMCYRLANYDSGKIWEFPFAEWEISID